MPPPVTVCCICNKEVFKSQTYHIGDGKRACKCHDGVIEKKENLENQERELREKERDREEKQRGENSQWDIRPKCGHCYVSGITSQEFYSKLLIYSETMKRKGKFINPLSEGYLEHVRESQGLKPGETLSIIFAVPVKAGDPLFSRLRQGARIGAELFGFTFLCAKCMEKLNVKLDLPKLDLEKLHILGLILEPKINNMVDKQIAKEAKLN